MSDARTEAVLFDVSGTLIRLLPPVPTLRAALQGAGFAHSEPVVGAALRVEIAYYLAHHHEASSEETLRRLRLDCATVLGGALGGHHPPVERLAALLAESLRFEVFADVRPTLDELTRRGLRLGVVSNWDCGLVDVLAGLGIRDDFETIVPSAAVGAPKPRPDAIQAALAALRVEPHLAVYVGDRPELDAVAAAAAGTKAVMIDRRRGRSRPRPGWIGSLTELLDEVHSDA